MKCGLWHIKQPLDGWQRVLKQLDIEVVSRSIDDFVQSNTFDQQLDIIELSQDVLFNVSLQNKLFSNKEIFSIGLYPSRAVHKQCKKRMFPINWYLCKEMQPSMKKQMLSAVRQIIVINTNVNGHTNNG